IAPGVFDEEDRDEATDDEWSEQASGSSSRCDRALAARGALQREGGDERARKRGEPEDDQTRPQVGLVGGERWARDLAEQALGEQQEEGTGAQGDDQKRANDVAEGGNGVSTRGCRLGRGG